MERIRKENFIRAYQYNYRVTRKVAEMAWKVVSESYKKEIVKGYHDALRLAFYND